MILSTSPAVFNCTAHVRLSIVQVDPSECKILLTDPPLNPTKNREKMVCQLHCRSCVFLQISICEHACVPEHKQ